MGLGKFNLICFEDLLGSLPKEQKSKELIEKLKSYYHYEINQLIYYSRNAIEPLIVLYPFAKKGDQFVADFWAKDLALPEKEQYNFHGQNVSQWLYAGCIMVQYGEVSAHH
jgi:hypothetical protein